MALTDSSNPAIIRDPAAAEKTHYDIAVVGGGIYGAMILLHAAARGLKTVLVEQDDFGGATSFNSLRVMHGGLRFLQSLDIVRSRQMIAARAWLLEHFGDLVTPMSCLMPLYNRGLKRTWTLAAALEIDNFLTAQANVRLPEAARIAPGHVVDAQRVHALFPQVNANRLRGGAIWQDGQLSDSPRLIMETLRWATSLGATALNYVECRGLRSASNRVQGISAIDRIAGRPIQITAQAVINAAGPASRRVAQTFDRDVEPLFRPSLAWNVLFRRPAISDHAVAVAASQDSAVHFLVPWKGRLLAGTGHARFSPGQGVSRGQLAQTLAAINQAVPGLGLEPSEVEHVFAGYLPLRRGSALRLATRALIHDHGQLGGPNGAFSVSGVKLVAAPLVAADVVNAVCAKVFGDPARSSTRLPTRPGSTQGWNMDPANEICADDVRRIAREEAVVHLSDLILRRTSLWVGSPPSEKLVTKVGSMLGFQGQDLARERLQLQTEINRWRTADPATSASC